MNKPIIPKEDGKLKSICNEAFFGVKSILPSSIRESRKYDKALAYILGGVAGHEVAHLGEYLINLANTYGADLLLERIVSHCLAATIATPIVSYLIAPKYVNNFIRENPTYSSGTAGVMSGAVIKALEILS